MDRHTKINDVVTAIEDRLDRIGRFAAIEHRQITGAKALMDLVDTVVQQFALPAAVVVLGPIDYATDLGDPALRNRTLNPGILVVTDYSAQFDQDAADLWTILDDLDDWWMPSADRGESLIRPITIDSAFYIPAGWSPIPADGRPAGLFNLIVIDPVANRT